jgi:hypothetical protein
MPEKSTIAWMPIPILVHDRLRCRDRHRYYHDHQYILNHRRFRHNGHNRQKCIQVRNKMVAICIRCGFIFAHLLSCTKPYVTSVCVLKVCASLRCVDG